MGEGFMRSLIAITASVTMLLAQVPLVPAYADTTAPAPQVATQNAAIAAAFNAYPNGGAALSKQVLGLVMSNPKLAPDVVIYMRNTPGVNRAQKLAAEHGLAAALDQLKIKAADLGVPIVTKDTVPVVAPFWEDAWFIAAALAALGAAIGIAAGQSSNGNGAIVINNTVTATIH
jgi:hypothetical protein